MFHIERKTSTIEERFTATTFFHLKKNFYFLGEKKLLEVANERKIIEKE
jgi:hypothetical protein